MSHPERSTLFIALIVCSAAVAQVFATQLTSYVFRVDSSSDGGGGGKQFSSPVSLTWFSMHALLFLAVPWLWEQWNERKRNKAAVSHQHHRPQQQEAHKDDFLTIPPRNVNYASTSTITTTTNDPVSMATFRGEGDEDDGTGGGGALLPPPPTHAATLIPAVVSQYGVVNDHHHLSNNSGHHDHSTTNAPLLLQQHHHLQPFEAALARAHPVLSSLQGVWRLVFLYMLYVAANVSYVKALQGLAPALVSAIFCAAPGLVLLLSWPVLGRPIQRIEVASVLLGLGGILMITQPWKTTSTTSGSDHDNSSLNALYATISPAASAVYKVFFAKFYSDASWKYVGSRLGGLAVVNLLIGTLLVVAYLSVGGEPDPTSSLSAPIPWQWILPSNAASIAFNFLINFGVTITFPLFVSVASLLSTAANLVIDAVFSGDGGNIGVVEVVGLFMVLLSLVVLLFSVWRRRKLEARALRDDASVDDDRRGGGAVSQLDGS